MEQAEGRWRAKGALFLWTSVSEGGSSTFGKGSVPLVLCEAIVWGWERGLLGTSIAPASWVGWQSCGKLSQILYISALYSRCEADRNIQLTETFRSGSHASAPLPALGPVRKDGKGL